MGLLDSTATLVAMFKATGGVQVSANSASTWGHFDIVPVGVDTPGGGAALSSLPSVVIARGALTGISEVDGVGDALTVAHASGNVVYSVRDVVPSDEDGGTIRVMLSETRSDV